MLRSHEPSCETCKFNGPKSSDYHYRKCRDCLVDGPFRFYQEDRDAIISLLNIEIDELSESAAGAAVVLANLREKYSLDIGELRAELGKFVDATRRMMGAIKEKGACWLAVSHGETCPLAGPPPIGGELRELLEAVDSKRGDSNESGTKLPS